MITVLPVKLAPDTVYDCATGVEPNNWLKVKVVGVTVKAGTGTDKELPVKETVTGVDPVPLVVLVMVPVIALPTVVGLKLTHTVGGVAADSSAAVKVTLVPKPVVLLVLEMV